MSGRIILMNGASSAGKSTIAVILQRTLDGYWVHTGIDHWLERLPLQFNAFVTDDTSEHDGLGWVMPGGSPPVTDIRVGPQAVRILSSTYRAYAGLAAGGTDLIVDDVIFDERLLRAAVDALDGVSALFVGVRCPTEVAEEREAARGNRMLGLARFQSERVHTHGVYDLEVDTASMPADGCAGLIKQRLEEGPPPSAFDRLRATFA